MREIGTPKIVSHITNSHIKRLRITVNQTIGSRKEAISGSHIREMADKKTAYNEGCQYIYFTLCTLFQHGFPIFGLVKGIKHLANALTVMPCIPNS